MANMIPIYTVTVGSSGASTIDFINIPQTYTDLKLVLSARGTAVDNYIDVKMSFNGSSTTSSWSRQQLEGGGGTVSTSTNAASILGFPPASSMTASTFGNIEVYIPNYALSDNKTVLSDSVSEGNTTSNVYHDFESLLWSNTSPISTITLVPSANNFAQYSTATLYGIRKY